MSRREMADVCLILEGTYPYVRGGVSNWTHDLICAQPHLTFHLAAIVPPGPEAPMAFTLPANVVGMTRFELHTLDAGVPNPPRLDALMRALEAPLLRLTGDGGFDEVRAVIDILRGAGGDVGRAALLDSRAAWDLLQRMCQQQCPQVSFLEYFWTWRTLLLGLYSVLRAPLVPARLYHPLCTGYAGLYATRAHVETGRPVLLNEHGIYTNERRVEIMLADWLQPGPGRTLSVDRQHRDLRDLWTDMFGSFSRACYAAAQRIVTLYEGNTVLQVLDGADPAKLQVIPNGVAVPAAPPVEVRDIDKEPPTVALIGRVVPIKDVKTFLRACALLREFVPNVRVWILGPTSEDPEYFEECRHLAAHLDLEATVSFKGQVVLSEYWSRLDVVVLTSVSEAQPLVILEAAAMGLPSVATDVGACREMILGRPDEAPPLGAAGVVTPLANPAATAQALGRLLTDRAFYQSCATAARTRVERYYDKADLDRAYGDLYRAALESADALVGA